MRSRTVVAAIVAVGTVSVVGGLVLARPDPPRAAAPAFGTAPIVAPSTTLPASPPSTMPSTVAVTATTAAAVAPDPAPAADTTSAPIATPVPAPPLVAPPLGVVLVDEGLSAEVMAVGVNPGGDLQLPEDPAVVGWWAAGAVPGATAGNVVLAGHIDSARRGVGVFAALLRAEADDAVEVTSTDGTVHRYRVVARQSYPKAALPAELFDRGVPPGLVLVTCGGEFDSSRGHYEDNIVVYAEPAA